METQLPKGNKTPAANLQHSVCPKDRRSAAQ